MQMERVLLLLIVLLPLYTAGTSAPAARIDADSTLLNCYRRCLDNPLDTSVLQLSDTLFRLAAGRHDAQMQASALACKADFYFYTHQLDSLRAWLPRIERFARANDQLSVYYTTWTRLIFLYTQLSQYAFARYEIEKFLARAEKDGYKPAVAQAYAQLAQIYRTKGIWQPAADHYRRAIDYIEENGIENFSVSNLYIQLSSVLTNLEHYDEALAALDSAALHLVQPERIWNIRCHEVVLRSKYGQTDEARELLERIHRQREWRVPDVQMLETEVQFYLAAGQYEAARASLVALMEVYDRHGVSALYYYSLFRDRAEIRSALGNAQGAYQDMVRYVGYYEQRVIERSETTLDEYAALLGVAQLNREKAELAETAQVERMRSTRGVIFSLCSVLLLSLLFITLLGRLNRKLVRAKRAAEDANRMKSIFIQHISHELNTPLNAIVGFAELAASERDAAERRSYLGIIRANSDSLQKLVDDVLYLSDVESTDRLPEVQTVDVEACCLRALERVKSTVSREVKLEFHPGEKGLLLTTSHAYLQQLLADLLHNAAKFTETGRIVLSCALTADRRHVEFTVTDTGCGIPASQADRIFERFFKIDTFRPGIGLGLSVCRLIAERLGGEVYLDKSYDKGAKFIVRLPLS